MEDDAVASGASPVKEFTPVVRALDQRARIRYLLTVKGKTQRDVVERASELYGEPISEPLVSLVISGDRVEGDKVSAVRRAIAELTRTAIRDLFDA